MPQQAHTWLRLGAGRQSGAFNVKKRLNTVVQTIPCGDVLNCRPAQPSVLNNLGLWQAQKLVLSGWRWGLTCLTTADAIIPFGDLAADFTGSDVSAWTFVHIW